MSNKIKVIICSPAGNITGLVLDRIPLNRQGKIARDLMQRFKEIEQVGYVTKATKPDALAKLQMMGGEYCGNATRALAYIITHGLVPFVYSPKLPTQFSLEVSGTSHLTTCLVNNQTVQIEVPLPSLTPIYQVCEDYHIVHLEGISYILVPRRAGNMQEARHILNERDFKPLLAVGVVYYEHKSRNIITIEPYVYVKKTRSFKHETCSASSAIAVSIKEAYQKHKSNFFYTIIPPSGIPLKTQVRRRGDMIEMALIKGPVKILGIKKFDVK